jgi:KDO2-lipid IV(A) lauroyltransferase
MDFLSSNSMAMLEKSIRNVPECYLWTHNRWKRTREEFNIRYDTATGKVDLGNLDDIKKRKGIK